jgi:hypothetical protein
MYNIIYMYVCMTANTTITSLKTVIKKEFI